MRKIILSICFCISIISLQAQPKIAFDKMTYDFGTIKEEEGKKTGRIEFLNEGDAPLLIVSVNPSCGCTAADYTKTAINPGRKGFIEFSYDPFGRPGKIEKFITVKTNEYDSSGANPKSSYLLKLIGYVEKRPPTRFELAGYPEGRGLLRIKKPTIRVQMLDSETRIDTFYFKNFGIQPVSIEITRIPAHITLLSESLPPEILPDQELPFIVRYDAGKRADYGEVFDHIIFTTSDSIDIRKQITFAITIREDFSGSDSALAPAMSCNTTTISLGEIKAGDEKEVVVVVENVGKSPLNIRKIKTTSGSFRPVLTSAIVPPGNIFALSFLYKAPQRAGSQEGFIEIISNDPENDVHKIKFDVKVVK